MDRRVKWTNSFTSARFLHKPTAMFGSRLGGRKTHNKYVSIWYW